MENQVKIKLTETLFRELCLNSTLSADMLLEVVTDDKFLENDEIYQGLKKVSIKQYKELQNYKFKKLHNIKD